MMRLRLQGGVVSVLGRPFPMRRITQDVSRMRMLRKIRELIVAHLCSRRWLYLWRERYTRALEAEIARLRAENRALVNSILGVAGIPPMRISLDAAALRATVHRDSADDLARAVLRRPSFVPARQTVDGINALRHTGAGAETAPACATDAVAHKDCIVPLRKRSWQQIGRLREIEDARTARRERETDTETFPAPRSIVPRV